MWKTPNQGIKSRRGKTCVAEPLAQPVASQLSSFRYQSTAPQPWLLEQVV